MAKKLNLKTDTLEDGGIEGLLLVFHLLAAGNGRGAPCRGERG